jgi:hypothetical protein
MPLNFNLKNTKQALILTPGFFLLFFWIAAFSDGNLFKLLGTTKTILFCALAAYGLSLSITLFVKSILTVDAKE